MQFSCPQCCVRSNSHACTNDLPRSETGVELRSQVCRAHLALLVVAAHGHGFLALAVPAHDAYPHSSPAATQIMSDLGLNRPLKDARAEVDLFRSRAYQGFLVILFLSAFLGLRYFYLQVSR